MTLKAFTATFVIALKNILSLTHILMNSSLNPPFEMGDQAKPKRCLEY